MHSPKEAFNQGMAVNWQPHTNRCKLTELWASLGKYEFVLPILWCLHWPIRWLASLYTAPIAVPQAMVRFLTCSLSHRCWQVLAHITLLPLTLLFLVCAPTLPDEDPEKKTKKKTDKSVRLVSNEAHFGLSKWHACAHYFPPPILLSLLLLHSGRS